MDDTISRAAAFDALNGIEISRNASWYEFYQKALTAVGALPSAQQWIPCSERLPQESQNVLTIDRYGDYEINHIIEDDEWYWEPSPVAWMPLPEPYRKE